MQSVLVTGAGGFVCRHIVTMLLKHGLRVIAADRAFDPNLRTAWASQPVTLLENSLWPDEPVDFVIHGAAVTASPEENGQLPEANFRANFEPLVDLLDWSAANAVKRLIFVSSGAVYRSTPSGPVDESQPQTPLGLYAVAKTAGEQLLETLRTEYGRDVLSIRLSNIYGTGERIRETRPRLSLMGRMIFQAVNEGRVTVNDPHTARDWTYAPDVGAAVYALLSAPQLNYAVYQVASEQVLTSMELAQAIQHILPHVTLEQAVNVNPYPLTRHGYLTHRRLAQDTGFNAWTTITDGMRQVIDWTLETVK